MQYYNLYIVILILLLIIIIMISSESYINIPDNFIQEVPIQDKHNIGNYLFNNMREVSNNILSIKEVNQYKEKINLSKKAHLHIRKYFLGIIQKPPISIVNINEYYRELAHFCGIKGIDIVYLSPIYNNKYLDPTFFVEKIIMRLPKYVRIGLIYDTFYEDVNFITPEYDYSGIYGGITADKAKTEKYGTSGHKCHPGISKINCDSGLCGNQPCISGKCRYYEPGCPNNIEQMCAYINVINGILLNMKQYSNISVIFNLNKKIPISQIYIASKLFPYLSNIEIRANHEDNDTINLDPISLYSIYNNSDYKTACFTEDCATVSLSEQLQKGCCIDKVNCMPTCLRENNRVKDTIINEYKDNPIGLISLLRKYKSPEVIYPPILDIGSISNNCISGSCGEYSSFGSWSWENFEKFLDLFWSGTDEIILTEWNHVSPSWYK